MKNIALMMLLFTCTSLRAQVNLIKNPSFEQYSECPDQCDEIKFATGWMSLDSVWTPPAYKYYQGVPEYISLCGSGCAGMPANYASYNYPHTGNGMAEAYMYFAPIFNDSGYTRDYLQGHLTNTLIAGQSYCVTFYVAIEQASQYAVNHIGAYFDDGSIDTTTSYHLQSVNDQYHPQIVDTAIIGDTVHLPNLYWTWAGKWTKIQGTFIANGTERLMTIANFFDINHTNAINIYDTTGSTVDSISGSTEYLVDDISVIKTDATINAGPDKTIAIGSADSVIIGDTLDSYLPTYWYVNGVKIDSNIAWIKVHPDTTTTYVVALERCGEYTYDTVKVWVGNVSVINIQRYLDNIFVYPNPASNEIAIENAKGLLFVIRDMLGKELYNTEIFSDKGNVNVSNLSNGVYVGEITDPVTGSNKIIKIVKK